MPPERSVKPLTTTGYAILSLLSLGEWTAYELEQQALRSLRFITPRARSVVYAEPKKLVRVGCAAARNEQRGRRSVAVYAITDTGRRALREWVATPPEFPTFEASVLVRTLFGGFGDVEGLIRSLHAQRDEARALDARLTAQRLATAADGGRYPDRLGWISINGMFLRDYLTMLDRWSDWAADQAGLLDADPEHAGTLARALVADGLPHRADAPTGDAAEPVDVAATPRAAAHVDVVRRFYGSVPTEPVRHETVWHVPGGPPVTGRYAGIADVFEAVPSPARALDEWRIELQDVMTNDDLVVALVRIVGRRGASTVDTSGAHVFRFADGVIAEAWGFVADSA